MALEVVTTSRVSHRAHKVHDLSNLVNLLRQVGLPPKQRGKDRFWSLSLPEVEYTSKEIERTNDLSKSHFSYSRKKKNPRNDSEVRNNFGND